MKKYTEEQVKALVEAADNLMTNAMDRGECFPGELDDGEIDEYPVDEDGDHWYSDYFDLFQSLKPFLEEQ